MPTLPANPTDLSQLSEAQFNDMLGQLFEPSPQLFSLCSSLQTDKDIRTYDDLIAAVEQRLAHLLPTHNHDTQDEAESKGGGILDAILSAHPRLGSKSKGGMSAASRSEQSHLHSHSSDTPTQLPGVLLLQRLNDEYEAAFPGLRYVTFARGRSLSEIESDVKRRVDRGDVWAERKEGVRAVCDIARSRTRT